MLEPPTVFVRIVVLWYSALKQPQHQTLQISSQSSLVEDGSSVIHVLDDKD